MAGEKILVVDDDKEITELISIYLTKEGFQVISSGNGTEVSGLIDAHKPDLIILDRVLPGLDGLDICRELRKKTNIPVLFLSGKNTSIDKIVGLEIGGDDYITKPFDPAELVARVKVHLRRSRLTTAIGDQILRHPGLEIDLASCTVRVNGFVVTLSAKEFQILSLLARNPNRVFTAEQLFQMIWNDQYTGDTRTVNVHLSTLRKKIDHNPSGPSYIQTVKGLGYKFTTFQNR